MKNSLVAGALTGALLSGIATFSFAPVARAESAAALAKELTLDQALAMAKRANKSLAVERTRLAQAKVSIDQAWSVLFPTVTAQGKYARNNTFFEFPLSTGGKLTIQPTDQWDGAMTASTLLFAPAVYPGLKAVEAGFEVAEEGARASEDAVLFAVGQAFYAAVIADEVMGVRDSNISVTRATLETARTRFAAGAVTKVDVDRAEIAVLRAEQAKREAELGRSQTYRSLAT